MADYRDYFNTRLSQEMENNHQVGISTKYDDLQQASQEKIKSLAALKEQQIVNEEVRKRTWVGKLGLDPNSIGGGAVNRSASFVSGASRMAGNIASMVPDLAAGYDQLSRSDEQVAAYNRYKLGIENSSDTELLNKKTSLVSAYQGQEATGPTALELFKREEAARSAGRDITSAFDLTGIVDQTKRDQLSADLSQNFDTNWDQTKSGFKNALKGNVAGAGDAVSGLAKLVFTAGESALSNPGASLEYITENIPQLATGLFGKAGMTAMTAANVGYAADNFQQGIQNYQKENNGALPPLEKRQEMAAYAASLALAENIGDRVGLGLMKAGTKDAARIGFKESLKNVAKVGTEGFVSEAATEGYQTFAEGEVTQKPATAVDIYKGAVIGGVAGAGLSAGGRAISEVAQATPEHVAKKEADKATTDSFVENAKTGNIDTYLDPKSKEFDPAKGIAALFANSQLADTTPEAKQKNSDKANSIVASLEGERKQAQLELESLTPAGLKKTIADLEAKLPNLSEKGVAIAQDMIQGYKEDLANFDASKVDPKAVKHLTDQIIKLDRQIAESTKIKDQLLVQNTPKEADVTLAVEKVNAPIDTSSEESQGASTQAADHVISLAMSHPGSFTDSHLKDLVENTQNALTTPQRSYLRSMSEARIAENALKNIPLVNKEIMDGDPAKNQLGIADYKQRMSAAVASGNESKADSALHMLTKFAEGHQQKLDTLKGIFNSVGTGAVNVVPTKTGWQAAESQDTSTAGRTANRKLGGLTISGKSTKLMTAITAESAALNAAKEQLKAAYALKFTSKPEVNSSPSVDAVERKEPPKSVQLTEGQTQSKVDSTVDSKKAPAVPVVTSATDVQKTPKEDVTTPVKSGKLEALKEAVDLTGKKFGEAYSSINLLAHNLIQKTSKADKTQRPLVAIHGFLSAWNAGNVDLQEFAGKEILLDPQKEFLDHFKVMAKEWLPTITKNFKKPVPNNEHRDIQPLQYLINSEKQEGYDYNITPENLKTAIALAAFSYVAENAKAPRTSTEEKIKRFFGLAEYDYINPKLVDALYELGTPEKAIAISLGQRAVQALGISAKTGATKDSLARLEADLGAHTLKLLVDQNILQRSYVSAATLREGLGKTEESGKKQGSMYFLQINQNKTVESISSKAVGTQGVLASVFGVESQLTMPSWTPIPVTQQTTDNTDQEVPDFLKTIIKHENSVANYVREDMWNLLNNLDDETFLRMAGYVDPDPTTMHHTEIKALKAKNDGLRRELEVFKEYVTTMSNSVENGGSPEGIKQALYLAHSVWKQQRVGIDGAINPQSSKIHRWLLTRASWLTEVSSTDTDNFFLRVAEGLGVKTDKQSNETSLSAAMALFNEKSTDPKTAEKAMIIMDAVRALVATNIKGETITPALSAAIQKGVKAGGGNMHSLDSLVAMAAYEHAKSGADGDFTFKVQLMGEVDGVTNGPMLSHLMMGAGFNATALFQRLNKGGFFQDASGYMNYNVWRGDSTHKDLYEETISKVLETLTALGTTSADVNVVMKSLWAVTGKLDDKGAITKDGRNIIKKPLTAMLFGSTLNNAVDGMFDEFLEKAYSGFGAIAKMDASKQKAALEAYVGHLNVLIGTVDARIPMRSLDHFLTKFEFSIEQEKRIGKSFKGSLGEAVKQTMKAEFRDFLDIRKVLNNTANTSFGLFNAAYQGVRQSVIAELIAAGDLAYREKKDTSLEARHDLTVEQEALIDARVAKLIPVVHTYMSKQSVNGDKSGLLMAKTARVFSKEHAYSVISQFAKALPPVEWSPGQWNSGAFSMTSAAYQRTQETPGVGMVVMMMHSLDSAISHIAAMGREVLNVHDAHGSGLAGFIETAKALNAATWKVAVGYSPATEMRDSFINTLKGMDEMLRTGKDKEAVISELKKFYAELAESRGKYVDGVKIPAEQRTLLTSEVSNIFGTAYQSDKTKYEALLQMQHIDQYALEGGQYDVTPEDRAEVQKLLDAMGTNHIPGSVWAMVDRINLAVLGTDVMNQPAKTDFGGLGQSTIQSDHKLVTFFEDKNTRTAKEVIDQLKGSLNTQNREILKKIIPLINMDMPIQMITQSTKTTDTISQLENARGWFSRKRTSDYIYVLSPEYSASGLTPELLLHELLHAALSRTIAKPKTPEAKALMVSLTTLKDAVVAHLETNPELKAKYSFEMTIDELVSWGMSDREFQQEVLEVIPMNRNVSLMGAFIRAISKFFKLTVMQDGIKVSNGMASLLHDVSGLFNETLKANQGKKQSGSNGVQTYAMASIDRLSTTDVYEALNEGKVTPTFDEHLRSLLNGIVTQLHGPYGSFKSLVASNTVKTPTALWNKAKRDGIAPFASASLASGIQINDQVAFVLEQVEATLQSALDNTTGRNYDVAVEMSKLYQEAATTFNEDGRDFHIGDWAVTTPAEQQRAKATYDFLFKTNGSLGTKADHLARFAALGLAHPEINAALSNMTSRESVKAGGSIAVRLERLFQKVLSWFNGKLTHTHDGQQANEKLTALVNQLVNIELARKAPMKESNAATVFINESIKKATESVKQGASKLGQSSIVQNSSSTILRASGKMLSAVAGERTDQIVEMMQKVRDSQLNQGHGMAMSMLNEVRGINKGNEEFHRLIRESKMREGTREELILTTSNVSLTSFANKGKDLTPQDKHAITAVFLRTGMADLLDHFTMAEITNLVDNKNSLDAAIKHLETQVDSFAKVNEAYKTQAKILAYKLAEGKVRGHHLMMNAHNIARMAGTGLESMVTEAQAKAATPIVDQLVSLYALQYTGSVHRAAAKKIMAIENARGNESGIEMVLKLQKAFQEDSKEKLFSGSEALMMKGYTPEIYDPRKEVLVATEAEGISLMAQGYTQGLMVSYDPMDPDRNTVRHVYKRSGGGLRPWLSTIFSYTGESSKGSRSKTDNVKDLSEWKANQQDLTKMNRDKASLMRGLLRPNPNFDPSKVTENFAAPIMNVNGQVTDYRYLMSENNKDVLLNRDNSFDRVLGVFAGSIFDKVSTKESNRKAVQALYDQYQADFATRAESYRTVGMTSTDNELRDIFRMLPADTKQAIKEIWGTEHMMVRSDLMDINFGYRKVSMTDAFNKEKKGVVDTLFVGLMQHVMGEKAEYNVRRAEDVWQEIVGEVKDILVIKNLSTLMGNISSNISLLFWQGVPLSDMVRYHRIAIKGMANYRRDSAALSELETKLKAGYITTTKHQMQQEIARLQETLARNPVKELIDAGLMPSIVEDVSPEDDRYSYKSELNEYVEGHTNKWNKKVIAGAKEIYMAKNTKAYQVLHHVTQLSDFVARYALYQHVTTRKDAPMSKTEAIQLASDSFINYDLPSHRKLQYLNDMGLTPFTKYYLRIQRVIGHLYAEHPMRAMGVLVFNHYMDAVPVLTDSGFSHKLGNNPFSSGALSYPGVLDELGTIKMLASPFK